MWRIAPSTHFSARSNAMFAWITESKKDSSFLKKRSKRLLCLSMNPHELVAGNLFGVRGGKGRGRRGISWRHCQILGFARRWTSAAGRGIPPRSFGTICRARPSRVWITRPEMIAAAQARLPDITFTLADIAHWNPPGPYAAILANAAAAMAARPRHPAAAFDLETRTMRGAGGADAGQPGGAGACADARDGSAGAMGGQTGAGGRQPRQAREPRVVLPHSETAFHARKHSGAPPITTCCPGPRRSSTGSRVRRCGRIWRRWTWWSRTRS